MTKRAIIHVENTEGILEFARYLADNDWTILSANKTEELLRREKIPVTNEPDLTENNIFFENHARLIQTILESRYPTSDDSYYRSQAEEKDIYIICMNLYPSITLPSEVSSTFTYKTPSNFFYSTVVRNATVNYENILILTDPADYKEAMVHLRTNNITTKFRTYLAGKALNLLSAYDSGIATTILFNKDSKEFINYLTLPLKQVHQLKSGANSHQDAALYRYPAEMGAMTGLQKLYSRDLNYHIINDASLAWEEISVLYSNLKKQYTVKSKNCDGYSFVTQFTPLTGTVFTIAIKYKSIISASLSTNVVKSLRNTYTFDTSSIKDVTIGCSSVIDEAAAKELVNYSIAAIIAPGFTPKAKETLQSKKNIVLIPTSKITCSEYIIEQVNGGVLYQSNDKVIFDHWNVRTKNRPSQEMADQMIFGMMLAMQSRTYSAVLLKNNSIIGISQACKSEQKAVASALFEAKDYVRRNNSTGESLLGDLLVCDTGLSLCDPVKELIDNGLKAIIQTGGSENDDEFVKYCDEHNVVMVFTDMTHIKY